MIKNICYLTIFFIFFFFGILSSQQITMKRNDYVTEIKININPDYIYSYYQKGNQIKVIFKNPIKVGINEIPKNPFIDKFDSNRDSISLLINKNIDVFMNKEKDGLKIILAKNKKFDDLLIKSQINPPKIVNSTVNKVNEEAENALIKIDDAINRNQIKSAIELINNFLKSNTDGFYAIEAYYKLGEAYMKLGETSDMYYKRAAEIFDNFTSRYPSYFRYNDALENAAIASYKAHDYDKALKFYTMISEKQPSSNKGKEALEKIGEIYSNIGQNDKAIETYLDYIKRYGDNTKIRNKIGYLYAKKGDFNTAYNYFYDFIESKQFDFERPDVLFEIAKVLENKKLYDRAQEIYKYIYEKHKDDINAREAIYRSAVIYSNLGDNELADKLLITCKNNYGNDIYGQLCALQYAEKHIGEQNGDYWKSFLNNVMNSENNDLRARALLLLIKAYYKEGNTEEAFNLMKTMETEYVASSAIEDEAKIKKDILRNMAEKKLKEGDIEESKKIIDELKKEFPNANINDLEKLKHDVLYNMAVKKLKEKDFEGAKKIIDELKKDFSSAKVEDLDKLKQEIMFSMAKEKLSNGDLEGSLNVINTLIREYPAMKNGDPGSLKQEVLYKMAERDFKNGDYEKSKNIIKALLQEFPDTKYIDELESILGKIENIKEKEKRNKFIASLNAKIANLKNYNDYATLLNYLRTIADNDNYTNVPIEGYIKKIYPDFINYLYNKGDIEGFTVALLDYISLVGKDNVDKYILSNLYKVIQDRIMEDVASQQYVSAINEYEKIKPVGIDREYLEVINEYISYALYKIGEKEKAKEFLASKTAPPNTKYGKLMNIVINNQIPVDEINKSTQGDIQFLINELKAIDPVKAYSVASAYKNNDNLTLTAQYEIIQQSSDENVRANLIADFFLTLKGKDKRYKEKFADVFYQAGLIYYDDNNYANVIDALSQYESVAQNKDNLAQAYYLMGKSYVKLNKIDLARQYFTRIINGYPTSPLSNLAKEELSKISS
jgi:tetratricopeptide (TPR) repeat protein